MTEPKRGDFCVVRFEDALPRLMLVVTPVFEGGYVGLLLVSNELEFATHRDIRVEPTDSQLGYPVLVETDVFVHVWANQLDEPIGKLDSSLASLARPSPSLEELEPTRLGPLLPGPWDSRWAWKEREINQAQRLAVGFLVSILDAYVG